MTRLQKFDASEFLTEDETATEYLNAALESNKPAVFLAAMGQVAKARSMSRISALSGLGRESLYKGLRPGAKPRIETVMKVLHTMGLRLMVSTARPARRSNGRRRQRGPAP